ncbi:MAG: restriction endonuclease subunit S [Bacilli bacterium]|nr:restriction endonuclease subunit S [Bacilli bacterium]
MSKIEKMLKEKCPKGVEYKKLEDLLDYIQPSKYIVNATNYNNNFDIPVLTAGQTFILGYTNEKENVFPASIEKPVIIFDDFTTSNHWVDFPFKVKSSAMKILVPKTQDVFRYIYYCISNIDYVPKEHSRQWIQNYSQFKIPVPPKEIQEEIVRILDKMNTELISYLNQEQELRIKQYEYWKKTLLDINHVKYPIKKLEDICFYSKDRISFNELNENNYISVENLLQNKKGKTSASHVPTSGNSTKFNPGDILIGNIRPYLKKIWLADCIGGTNGDVLDIRIKDNNIINSKYLFYVLSSDDFFEYDNSNSKGAKMPRGSKDLVMKYNISLPPIQEQEKITNILDRFEKLLNDIDNGIPAEIELRKKQYEYYRNKLLSFEEMIVNE